MTNGGILCIGAIMADVMSHVPKLPQRGEGVVVERTSTQVGGCAFNSANIIRQLGVPCRLFAPLGKGLYASFVREELAARGLAGLEVDTQLDCGSCLCLVEPDGERTMITTPGIERCFEAAWFDLVDGTEFSASLASGYEIDGEGGDAIIGFFEANPHIEFWFAPGPRTAYLSPEKLARIEALRPCWHLNDLELLQLAQRKAANEVGGHGEPDVRVSAGCGELGCKEAHEHGEAAGRREPIEPDENNGAWRAALAHASDGASAFERIRPAGETLAATCKNAVVVTLGAEGAAVFFPDGTHIAVPTEPVDPIDTVGAGDTHLGALLAARHAGLPWEEALALANRMAGLVCQHQGGTIPDDALGFAACAREGAQAHA